MRIAVVILALTGIAVALVGLRRQELRYRQEFQRLEMRRRAIRPEIWRHEARIRRQVAVEEVRRRAWAMGVEWVPRGDAQYQVVRRPDEEGASAP